MTTSNPARIGRFPLQLNRMGASADPKASTLREPLRPQRLLRDAAHAASRTVTPTGLGMDSAGIRAHMVQRLRDAGASNEAVLLAMMSVQRHLFIDSALAAQAYEDTSLPIGHGQTISKPSVVARMLSLLFEGQAAHSLGHLGRALEIGTGCGYQAALLQRLARHVVSIERVAALHARATAQLHTVASNDLVLVHGDGMIGHAASAPFQSIIAAAGGDALPPSWLSQLAAGGRLVAPVHQGEGAGQALVVIDRDSHGNLHRQVHDAVLFVPLKSGTV